MNRRLSDYAISVLRLYIGGNAVNSWYNATNGSNSLLGQAIQNIDGLNIVVWVMATFGTAIVVDVIINDVMPERFQWEKALKHRHILLTVLMWSYIALPFISSLSYKEFPLILTCFWHASIIYLASFLDAKKRSRELACALIHR